MIKRDPGQSEQLARVQQAHERIALLLPRLARANKLCIDAARPLDFISELDFDHQRELARNIRVANQEWEEVTKLISDALTLVNNNNP